MKILIEDTYLLAVGTSSLTKQMTEECIFHFVSTVAFTNINQLDRKLVKIYLTPKMSDEFDYGCN